MEYTQYLTYLDYQEMGGTLPENEFNLLERKSHNLLDYFTFNRIPQLPEIPQVVKDVMFEYISTFQIYRNPSDDSRNLSSYSNGVESLTFSTKTNASISKELQVYAKQYLPDYLTARSVSYDLQHYLQSDHNHT